MIDIIILEVVVVIEVLLIAKLFRNSRRDRKMIGMLLKDKISEEMGDMVENINKGLENLFNPKEENNVKKTRTNRKIK